MAGKVQMNPDEAASWLQRIEALNGELDSEVNGSVSACEAVQQVSSGSIVDELSSGIAEMANAASNLVNAFANLASSIAQVVTAGTQAVETVGGLIAKVLPYMGL